MGNVLEAVMRCGVLVQGCWVVASHVIYTKPEDAAKRTARDYIVSWGAWIFSTGTFQGSAQNLLRGGKKGQNSLYFCMLTPFFY